MRLSSLIDGYAQNTWIYNAYNYCRIDLNFMIKVADFGLSESIDVNKNYFRQSEQNTIKLPIKWLAIESINDRMFSEKTDVVRAWLIRTGRCHDLSVV